MILTVKLTGLDGIRSQFAALSKAPQQALDATAVKVEDYISDQIGKHAKTGMLERSLGKKRIADGWEIGHDSRVAPYARFVHDGTKPHKIFPRNKKALRWATANQAAFAKGSARGAKYLGKANSVKFGFFFSKKGINHPGTKPDKWMERAAALAPNLFRAQLEALFSKA